MLKASIELSSLLAKQSSFSTRFFCRAPPEKYIRESDVNLR